MLLNLFSRREATAVDAAGPLTTPEQERDRLHAALCSVLEALPQSFSGRENIRLLCDTVAVASPHLRFVWLGFAEERRALIRPWALAGEAQLESTDWSLPLACFERGTSFLQQLDPANAADIPASDLFHPWRDHLAACSARSALATPLRSEKAGLRGMMVFYADHSEYFDRVGLPIMTAFCHVAEIIWKQSNLVRVATQVAQQDPLTGLIGRRHAMTVLEKEIARTERAERPLSLLLCRVDGVNALNDMYGLHATDAILAAFSKEAVELLGSVGVRWSGTQFIFLLPGVSHAEAEAAAVRLQEHFRHKSINVRNWSTRLALRVGTGTYTRHSLGIDDLILQAHQSLLSTGEDLPSSVL